MASRVTVTQLAMGDYLTPVGLPREGARIPIVAHLVRHPDATILFDTGFPWDVPTVDEDEQPPIPVFPVALQLALEKVGARLGEVQAVANCHLHADHGGGNFRVGRLPIYVQRVEFASAREPLYTIAEGAALDAANYVLIEGEHEILPGIRLVPTPGHTPGHQSLVVETDDGPVVLLGQAVGSASDYALHAYNARLEADGDANHPPLPAWWARIQAESPREVRFAHDFTVWRPDATTVR